MLELQIKSERIGQNHFEIAQFVFNEKYAILGHEKSKMSVFYWPNDAFYSLTFPFSFFFPFTFAFFWANGL